MFGEIPGLKSDEAEYDQLIHETLSTLWSFVIGDDLLVAQAAFNALEKFPIEDHKLKILPEKFRLGISLPSEYAKTPGDAVRNPEDVLPYIPGTCWLQFLEKINPDVMKEASKFVISLIEKELEAFPRGIFYLYPGKAEPSNYSNLPHRSICRGFVDYLKRYSESEENPALIKNVLTILGHKYSKLLPPLNWNFLGNFQNDENYSKECLTLTAKQGESSPSAKYLAESYVKNFSPKIEEVSRLQWRNLY